MFTKLKNLFKPAPKPHWAEAAETVTLPPIPEVIPPKVRAKRGPAAPKKPVVDSTAKDRATALNEPYVAILSVDIDPTNINNGSFEFDWNDKFLLNLIKAGYKTKDGDTDAVIVDRWFHTVCRNVVMEMYEQFEADPENRDPDLDTRIINRRPLGDGRSEIS